MQNFRLRLLAVAALCAAATADVPVATAHPEGEPWGRSETTIQQASNLMRGDNLVVYRRGQGYFHAAEVIKTGGASGHTILILETDGRPSMDFTFAGLSNPMRWIDTPDMMTNARNAGNTATMTLWFRSPIEYRSSLRVTVHAAEDDIADINLRVLHSVLDEDADHAGHDH